MGSRLVEQETPRGSLTLVTRSLGLEYINLHLNHRNCMLKLAFNLRDVRVTAICEFLHIYVQYSTLYMCVSGQA